MRTTLHRWLVLVGLAMAPLVVGSGCSFLAPFYFMAVMAGMDGRIPPKFVLPEDAKRIVVVTSADTGTQIDAGHVDQELNELVSRKLFEGFSIDKKTKEIQIIRSDRLARWQDEHPHSTDLNEIGRALNADYVIHVDVDQLDFYQGGNRMLFQGQADIAVSVIKVNGQGDGEVVFPAESFNTEFPRGRPIPATDWSMARFRRAFLLRLAEQISWFFVPHEGSDGFGRDPF